LEIALNYQVPGINRCGVEPLKQASLERVLTERLKAIKPPRVEIVKETGAFKISNLPEIRCEVDLHTAQKDDRRFTVDIGPSDHLNISAFDLYRADASCRFWPPPALELARKPRRNRAGRVYWI